MGEFVLIVTVPALTIPVPALLVVTVFIADSSDPTIANTGIYWVRRDHEGHFMTEYDDIALLSNRIDLGYLSRDLSFMSRVLYAQVRWANADLAPEAETLSGGAALLGVIARNPGISQNDLAAAVALKKSAVTRFVRDMETEGLIIREKPRSDRRYNALRLSPAGDQRWSLLQQQMSARQEDMLAPLTARERDRLFQLLGRLLVNFADQPGASDHQGD